MVKGSKWIEANSGENTCFGSCETHHVGSSPREDRGGAAGEVGEVEGGKKEMRVRLEGADSCSSQGLPSKSVIEICERELAIRSLELFNQRCEMPLEFTRFERAKS